MLLTILADRPAPMHSASELSELSSVPRPTTSKILKVLGRSGILDSQRGVHGGYQLARPPGEISMAEIIEALEGPIAFTQCTDVCGCEMEEHCPVQANWQVINRAIRGALDGISLEELASPAGQTELMLAMDPRRSNAAGRELRPVVDGRKMTADRGK